MGEFNLIILDEYSYAKKLSQNGLSSFMSGRDIRILIKYFRLQGIEEGDLYDEIVKYLNKYEKDFDELSHQKFLLDIIKTSKNSILKKFDSVIITENEFNKIRSLKNYRLEKILFTMLFLSKFYFQTGKNYSKEIKNKYTLKMTPYQILNFAKIDPRIREFLFYELFEKGVVDSDFGKDDAYYILDFYKNDDSPPKLIIESIVDFADYYKPCCEICGVEIEKTGRNHRMCDDCWNKQKKELWKKNSRKYYEKKKLS